MVQEPWKRKHRDAIVEKESLRRTHGGEPMEEASWRQKRLGRGIVPEAFMEWQSLRERHGEAIMEEGH